MPKLLYRIVAVLLVPAMVASSSPQVVSGDLSRRLIDPGVRIAGVTAREFSSQALAAQLLNSQRRMSPPRFLRLTTFALGLTSHIFRIPRPLPGSALRGIFAVSRQIVRNWVHPVQLWRLAGMAAHLDVWAALFFFHPTTILVQAMMMPPPNTIPRVKSIAINQVMKWDEDSGIIKLDLQIRLERGVTPTIRILQEQLARQLFVRYGRTLLDGTYIPFGQGPAISLEIGHTYGIGEDTYVVFATFPLAATTRSAKFRVYFSSLQSTEATDVTLKSPKEMPDQIGYIQSMFKRVTEHAESSEAAIPEFAFYQCLLQELSAIAFEGIRFRDAEFASLIKEAYDLDWRDNGQRIQEHLAEIVAIRGGPSIPVMEDLWGVALGSRGGVYFGAQAHAFKLLVEQRSLEPDKAVKFLALILQWRKEETDQAIVPNGSTDLLDIILQLPQGLLKQTLKAEFERNRTEHKVKQPASTPARPESTLTRPPSPTSAQIQRRQQLLRMLAAEDEDSQKAILAALMQDRDFRNYPLGAMGLRKVDPYETLSKGDVLALEVSRVNSKSRKEERHIRFFEATQESRKDSPIEAQEILVWLHHPSASSLERISPGVQLIPRAQASTLWWVAAAPAAPSPEEPGAQPPVPGPGTPMPGSGIGFKKNSHYRGKRHNTFWEDLAVRSGVIWEDPQPDVDEPDIFGYSGRNKHQDGRQIGPRQPPAEANDSLEKNPRVPRDKYDLLSPAEHERIIAAFKDGLSAEGLSIRAFSKRASINEATFHGYLSGRLPINAIGLVNFLAAGRALEGCQFMNGEVRRLYSRAREKILPLLPTDPAKARGLIHNLSLKEPLQIAAFFKEEIETIWAEDLETLLRRLLYEARPLIATVVASDQPLDSVKRTRRNIQAPASSGAEAQSPSPSQARAFTKSIDGLHRYGEFILSLLHPESALDSDMRLLSARRALKDLDEGLAIFATDHPRFRTRTIARVQLEVQSSTTLLNKNRPKEAARTLRRGLNELRNKAATADPEVDFDQGAFRLEVLKLLARYPYDPQSGNAPQNLTPEWIDFLILAGQFTVPLATTLTELARNETSAKKFLESQPGRNLWFYLRWLNGWRAFPSANRPAPTVSEPRQTPEGPAVIALAEAPVEVLSAFRVARVALDQAVFQWRDHLNQLKSSDAKLKDKVDALARELAQHIRMFSGLARLEPAARVFELLRELGRILIRLSVDKRHQDFIVQQNAALALLDTLSNRLRNLAKHDPPAASDEPITIGFDFSGGVMVVNWLLNFVARRRRSSRQSFTFHAA